MRVNDAYSICLLFEDRRFGALPRARLFLQPADEGAESEHAAGVSLPGQLSDAMQIGQATRAAFVESEGSVGANRVQQATDGFGNGKVIALTMELAQDGEGANQVNTASSNGTVNLYMNKNSRLLGLDLLSSNTARSCEARTQRGRSA